MGCYMLALACVMCGTVFVAAKLTVPVIAMPTGQSICSVSILAATPALGIINKPGVGASLCSMAVVLGSYCHAYRQRLYCHLNWRLPLAAGHLCFWAKPSCAQCSPAEHRCFF
jgi:hypothetical protein